MDYSLLEDLTCQLLVEPLPGVVCVHDDVRWIRGTISRHALFTDLRKYDLKVSEPLEYPRRYLTQYECHGVEIIVYLILWIVGVYGGSDFDAMLVT